jgi:hypothetical protein
MVPGLGCGIAGSGLTAGKAGADNRGTGVLLGLFMTAGDAPLGVGVAALTAGRPTGASIEAGAAGLAAGGGVASLATGVAAGADAAWLAAGVVTGVGGTELGLLARGVDGRLTCIPCNSGVLRPPEPASTKPRRTRLTTG